MAINFSDTPNLENATVSSKTSSNIATDRVQRMEESLDIINEDGWSSEINYYEYGNDGGSNLYVTWCDSASNLKDKLEHHNLEVRCVINTNDDHIYNVVFENH